MGLPFIPIRRWQGIYSIMSHPRVSVLARDQGFAPLGWLYGFKARAKNVIAQTLRLPEPQVSLLTGISWAMMWVFCPVCR